MLLVLLGNCVGRSIEDPRDGLFALQPVSVGITSITAAVALVAAVTQFRRYAPRREVALLTVWLMLARSVHGLVRNPRFLELRRHDATHPVWLGRQSAIEPLVTSALALRVRFVWALPAVLVQIAGMTEVAPDVCRGPGLAMYPLRTCTSLTLVCQVIAGVLVVSYVWAREDRARRRFLRISPRAAGR